MNWMVASITASAMAACGPLLMVESVPAVRALPELRGPRRLLAAATVLALLAVGVWLGLDRLAISRGARSFVVAGVSAALFFALFIPLGYPILERAGRARHLAEPRVTARPFLRVRWDVPVVLVLVASAVAFATSPNDIGYRTKGVAIVMAGGWLYFLGRPRAPLTFLLCALSGGITLFAQWQVPWQRAVGAFGQVSVGIVGLAWCARLLVRAVAESPATDKAA